MTYGKTKGQQSSCERSAIKKLSSTFNKKNVKNRRKNVEC
ncbi:hypothetical protein HMPREF3226_02749 [Prevotella corporis]|uniref:Uncharacterized protein n=1 Tax=Prevotella corporis TaxID=28128 RepID=A0A133PTU4_9BACT|nr:hypothetical protein HMPREF3226_02749 [Prevotella corporis]